jgi:hypothetical protein
MKALIALSLVPFLFCGAAARAGQGGGYTLAGLVGQYYANTNLSGPAGFTRRDCRLDFGDNSLPPGGAGHVGDAAFRSVPAAGFSARWTGQVIPRFSETYTFRAEARDSFQLRLRPTGASDWTTVIDQASYSGSETSGSIQLVATNLYDIEVTLTHGTGPWKAQLRWSSPSTPIEVIDPLVQSGFDNPDWTAGFTDIVKGARNSWEPANGGQRPSMDADGWPTGDGAFVFQESLNQGLDVDPLMRGVVTFQFSGKATVGVNGNLRAGSLKYKYDSSSNLTTGSFVVTNNGWNASYFTFTGSTRNGQQSGPGGITNLRLMRPVAPDSSMSYDPANSLFTPQILEAMSHFTVIRHQYVANQQRDWTDRTTPGFFNQNGGTTTAPHYGVGDPSNNGASWEHKVLLANESGRDLMISIPTVASGHDPLDTSSYLWNLANLLCYGSDGVNPYTTTVADPIYPPLNPNLRVYLELENELWNWGGVFYTDFGNINAITAADVAATNGDFRAFNYDGLSTAKDATGAYVSMNTWRYRKIMMRMMQASDIFRSVFGDGAMMSRIRPLYEWQYANANNTARLALSFADRYFNNGDGGNHVPNPQPIQHWLWGGGGATYYGAVNGNGLTTLLTDPSFATPVLGQPGYLQAPTGGMWSFTGNAGIARNTGGTPGLPPPYAGSQMGYIMDQGSLSVNVTFPSQFTSPVFAVSFKAVNRFPTASTNADAENLRVYLDGTNDITARTFSQGNGYTPPAYDASYPWTANNVFWTHSEYYFTRSFSVQPGSTHSITFRGRGNLSNPALTGQTVFIGEVRITSVDRIFQDGMPGGGEATGQPVGEEIQSTMNNEASWAKAFGLEELSYESGWSLGGDDGGSWVQLVAKYGDPRTADVQGRFMDMFYRAGSVVNMFGTYAQWPSWSDFYAAQGFLDVAAYPIIQGIDNRAAHLSVESTNGVLAPSYLIPITSSLTDNADSNLGRITTAGGWINWNVIAPLSGQYQVTASMADTNMAAVLSLDNIAVGPTGQLTANAFLTKGLHSVKVRSVSTAAVQVRQVSIGNSDAPSPPALLSVLDGDALANLSWSSVSNASDYQIRYGSSPGAYFGVIDAGTATSWTLTGLSNNQQYFFVVLAGNNTGFGLPSAEKSAIPLGIGQVGTIAMWNFTGASGNETGAAPSSASSRLQITALHRGPGLDPSQSDWAASMRANRFGSEPSNSAGHSYGTNFSGAVAKGQYYEFSVRPVAGQTLSLSKLTFSALFQNSSGNAGVAYSTYGVNFSAGLPANGSPGNSTTPWTVDFSSQSALQQTSSNVVVRIYVFGLGPYTVNALGPAIAIIGSVAPGGVVLKIERQAGAIQLSWPSTGAITNLLYSDTINPLSVWAPLNLSPQPQTGSWSLTFLPTTQARFFRLGP